MRRRLRNLLTAMSLVLCVAIVVAGVRSYFRVDQPTRLSDKATGARLNTWAWDWATDWGRIGVGRDARATTYPSVEDALRVERAILPEFIHQTRPAVRAQFARGSLWNRPGFFWVRERSHSDAAPESMRRRSLAETGRVSWSSDHWFVWAPLWPFALATAAPPAAWWIVRRRRRNKQRRRALLGLCPSCGYDLHATPGRCPEFGTAAGSGKPTTAASSH